MNRRRVRALIWKEFRQLRRDPMLVRLLLFMPVLQLLLFGYVVAVDVRSIATAVVDLDRSAVSRALADSFEASGYFKVTTRPASEAALQPLLDGGQVRVAVVIPEGTEATLLSGGRAGIGIVVDGSDSQISSIATGYASQVVAHANSERLSLPPGVTAPGIDARIRVLYNPTLAPINTMIPGLIAAIVMLSLGAVMSQAVVRERESGTLEQLFVTPIRPTEYIIGKVTPYALLSLGQMVIVLVVGLWWFGVPFQGNAWIAALGLGLFLLVSIGLGLLISLASRTRAQAIQTVLFVMLPMMVLSGFLFPVESMPALVQPLTALLPLTHALTVLRSSFLKDSTLADLAVPLLALAGFAIVTFGWAVLATRRRLTE